MSEYLARELQPLGSASDIPNSSEFTLSDARIRGILGRLGVILHGQISQADTFFKHGGGYDHRQAVPLDDDELRGWRSIFGIDDVVQTAIDERQLHVVAIEDEGLELTTAPENARGAHQPTPTTTRHPRQNDQGDPNTTRVNYGGEAHWIPNRLIRPVASADGLTYVINPQLHFGGQNHGSPGRLYNAFVALDMYVQAPNGTQLVSRIPGTGVPGSPSSRPVYNPHVAIGTSLWMNTSIVPEQPNSLSVRIDNPRDLMLGCSIHNIAALAELDVPRSDKLQMWFWQLDRLIGRQALALPESPLPVET